MATTSKQEAATQTGPMRITVTLPRDDYERVCLIANTKKVSASWVVRDAVEEYLRLDTPLFGKNLK
jgi:metal-responsive CopG/Arc/MetJ family transcriptional regulator